MNTSTIKLGPNFTYQDKYQNVKTEGFSYSDDAINSAVVTNPNDAYVVKHITKTIEHVDKFIKNSGKAVSPEDREDMIQEAILANLEKTKKENYENSSNRTAVHDRAEIGSLNKMQKYIDKNSEAESFETLDETYTLDDLIAEKRGSDSLKPVFEDVLETLTPRESYVIRQKYGIGDMEPKTNAQIARDFNVSPEQIRQIETKALKRLRHPSRTINLKNEIFVAPNGTLYSLG